MDAPTSSKPPELARSIGVLSALGIMVGVTVGSGIFRSPTQIAAHSHSPAFVLALWTVGGIVSLFGAFTFAELCTLYPKSGGLYVFLREGYGRWLSFVFGWTYMLLSKPFAAAGIATVTIEHLGQVLDVQMTFQQNNQLFLNGTGQTVICVLLIILTWINSRGVSLSAWITTGFTAAKVAAIVAIVLLALALRRGDTGNFTTSLTLAPEAWWLALAPIMSAVLWTYDGWADIGAMAGEVKNPNRNLPKIFLLGTALIVALYFVVNAIYIWMIPLPQMAKLGTVAPAVMEKLLGAPGAVAAAALIAFATFGATQASIITGARVTYAQARDGLLFAWLGRVHPKHQTPAASLWFQCLLSCVAVVALRNFQSLADGFVFTIWIFYGLAGASIFILRIRRPDLPRPYRCAGYPVIPALFVLVSLAMTTLAIIDDWRTTTMWLGVLVAGIPVYFIWDRLRTRSTLTPPSA